MFVQTLGEPANRFVELVFVPFGLEIDQLLANLVEPPPVAAVGIGAGFSAVEIGSYPVEQAAAAIVVPVAIAVIIPVAITVTIVSAIGPVDLRARGKAEPQQAGTRDALSR